MAPGCVCRQLFDVRMQGEDVGRLYWSTEARELGLKVAALEFLPDLQTALK